MTLLEVHLSESQVSRTQADARRVMRQLARSSRGAKVEVDARLLSRFVRFIEGVQPADDPKARRPRSVATGRGPALAEDREISPQEAAAILGMSRPSVMRLIGMGELHPRKVHSRNRLSLAEVQAYKERGESLRRKALRELTTLSEQYDF